MGGRSILISGVTEQHKRACDSFNLCLLVMASARLIKGRALRWQVQGVASAFASACACLGVVIASIDTMRLRHRCGCVNRYDALASPLLLRLRYAALAYVILSHFKPTVCHTRGGACTSRGGLARGVAAPVAGAVQF